MLVSVTVRDGWLDDNWRRKNWHEHMDYSRDELYIRAAAGFAKELRRGLEKADRELELMRTLDQQDTDSRLPEDLL